MPEGIGEGHNRNVTNWAFGLRALRSRNYRLFFSGQTVSLIGTWMTRIAASWLVYRLTDSPMLLGLASFAGQIPAFFLAPLAGVWVDRWDRHRTLVVTQVLSMLQSFALAALALAHIITVWEVVWLALAQGLINAFDMPARQAFVVQMVENREDLSNAIALNSSMVNAARLMGPALAGIVIAAVGEGYCFLVDGMSYVAVIASLLWMRLRPAPPRRPRRGAIEEWREGWRYVTGSAPIRSILLLLGLVSLVAMPYTVLMPIFASKVLHGGPHTLGFLMAAIGAGALGGAATAGDAQERARAGKAYPGGGRAVRCFADRVCAVAHALAVAHPSAGHGLWHDAADGVEQYHSADHRGRREAGPRDGLLLDGVPGHDAVRKPAGRQPGSPYRRSGNARAGRRGVPGGQPLVHAQTSRNPGCDAAHLCRDGNPDAARELIPAATIPRVTQPANGGRQLLDEIENAPCPAPRLWWLGHSGFALKYRNAILYIDPLLSGAPSGHSGRLMAPPFAAEDVTHAGLILCTHAHPGHLDPDTLPAMLSGSRRAKLLIPMSVAGHAHALGIDYRRMVTTNADLRVEYLDDRIYAVPSAHNQLDWTPLGGYPYLGYLGGSARTPFTTRAIACRTRGSRSGCGPSTSRWHCCRSADRRPAGGAISKSLRRLNWPKRSARGGWRPCTTACLRAPRWM